MTLSIIIVNYKVEHYLELCLDSVFSAIASFEAEVIIVDNNSQDGSEAMVSRLFPEVRYIANKENFGFSKANNRGVESAKGEFICILNPDTVVSETTFTSCLTFARNRKKVGAIGLRLIDGSGAFLPESKRNLPTPKVSLNKMMGDGSAYYANHLDEFQTGKVDVLVGAFMFMRKAVYESVGGFDERYFMYGEDIDLSYTITQAGYTNYYLGEQSILHFKGESTIKDKKYRERFYGAMRLFYEKHLRKNVLESTMVKAGLQGAIITSGLKNSKQEEVLQSDSDSATTYYLKTDSVELLEAFAKAVAAPVLALKENSRVETGSQIVYDASTESYMNIIKRILALQGQSLTFKIIPKNSTFAIGSNTSEGKGEIIWF